jgi:hypothetical protein
VRCRFVGREGRLRGPGLTFVGGRRGLVVVEALQ